MSDQYSDTAKNVKRVKWLVGIGVVLLGGAYLHFTKDQTYEWIDRQMAEAGIESVDVGGTIDGALEEYEKYKQDVDNISALAYETQLFDLYKVEDYDGAAIVSEEFLEKFPNNAEAYFHSAYIKEQNGELEGAENDYLKAVDLGSKNAFTYNNLGVLAAKKGAYEEAKDYYLQAFALEPENELFQQNIDLIYEQLNEKDSEVPEQGGGLTDS